MKDLGLNNQFFNTVNDFIDSSGVKAENISYNQSITAIPKLITSNSTDSYIIVFGLIMAFIGLITAIML